MGLFSVVLAIPVTREAGTWLLLENHPVEIATFVFLMAAGVVSLHLAWTFKRHGGTLPTQLFYIAFGLGLFLTALEEVAWGQYWLGFETPGFLGELNVKGEATLHNISGVDGRTEILRMVFGLGGLIGVGLSYLGRLRAITPPTVLWTWFAVITVLAMYDLANDLGPTVRQLDLLVFHLNELVEMLIGLASLLFVSLKSLEMRAGIPDASQHPG